MSIKYLCGIDVDNGLLYTDTANDRVGIGTTSPSRLLTLKGADTPTIEITDTTTPVTLNISAANSRASVGTVTSHPLRFLTNDTERMRIHQSNGDVGIGTTSPGAKLDVVGTIRATNPSGNQASLTGSSLLFPDAATTTIGANIVNFNTGTKNLIIGGNSTKWNDVTVISNTYKWSSGGIGNTGELNISSSSMDVDVLLKIEDGVNIENLANATSDTDRFLVSDPGQSDRVKYRTGAQLAADIGAVTGGPFLPLAPTGTDVVTGDVRIAENKYFRFGASANAAGSLIIGHTNFGSPYSQILENGTGDLKISATNLILESANAETYIDCNFNSSVDLYHNNVKKFATLSTGASVNGSLGINTTSPNTQIEIVNSEDQTSTLRLTTSDNSSGNVSGEISFALDGSTVGAKIQSIINANEDGTDLKLDSTNTTLTGDLTVSGGDISLSGTGRIQGVDTVSASTDAANKAYVDAHVPTDTQTILFSNFQDSGSTTSSLRIPFNTLNETTSNQYYNHFDCPADGTIKRIRMQNTSGSLSTSFTTIFDIWKNATGTPTQSSGSLTASGGSIEYDPNLSFSKGDNIQIGYRKSAGAKYWQGVSASIILEFEQV
jgi:hypothetical protein